DDEGNLEALLKNRFELAQDLFARFESRPPAKRHDDVAELALKRAAAGKLNAAEKVMAHFEQVVPRHRQCRHVRFFGLLIAIRKPARLPVAETLGTRLLRLPDR